MFDNEQINSVSLNYLKNLLTNKEPSKEYEKDLKVINMVHIIRMKEDVD